MKNLYNTLTTKYTIKGSLNSTQLKTLILFDFYILVNSGLLTNFNSLLSGYSSRLLVGGRVWIRLSDMSALGCFIRGLREPWSVSSIVVTQLTIWWRLPALVAQCVKGAIPSVEQPGGRGQW